MLERRLYQERPERFEYRLTEKGIDLWPVLFTLMRFGDKHYAGEEKYVVADDVPRPSSACRRTSSA